MIELNDHLASQWPIEKAFDAILALRGETYRRHKHRRTFKCEIGGREYFVKIHQRPGWREILKDALRFRRPIVTVRSEVRAVERCRELGVPTVTIAGHGTRGRNPARVESFIITEPLAGFVHLDEWIKDNMPARRMIVKNLATITKSMHEAGMNHRDLYLCHFMLPSHDDSAPQLETLGIHVIDLHRAQLRARIPSRWLVKDLAAILFSSLDLPITTSDCVRFLRVYFGPDSWREAIRDRRGTLRRIVRRAVRVYRDEHGRSPRLSAGLRSFAGIG